MWTKIIRIAIPISRLPILAAPNGSRPNAGNCTENDNINVFSDVDPSTNVEENHNDSNDQENDNLSCLENEMVNENSLFHVDSALGLDNDKTLHIIGQEKKDFGNLLIIS